MSDTQALEIFLKSPVTQDMIHHLVNVTLQVLPCESSKTITQQMPSPPNSPPIIKTKPLPSLMTFITKLVRYTNVYTGTLMSTIVFLNRLKTKLPKDAQGLPCTRHRIFLACLIISSKHHNDSSPKNKHWSKYTDGLFRKEDVNLMERQLLMLLDWDLRIETDELLRVWKRFLDPIKADLKKQSKIRNNLSKGMIHGSTQTILVPKASQVSPTSTPRYQKPSPNTPRHTAVAPTPSPMPQLASSRSSSISSLDSLCSNDSLHSRASSVSSIMTVDMNTKLYPVTNLAYMASKPTQYMAPPQQQLPPLPQPAMDDYNLSKLIDSVALKEEQELNNLMRQYCGSA